MMTSISGKCIKLNHAMGFSHISLSYFHSIHKGSSMTENVIFVSKVKVINQTQS